MSAAAAAIETRGLTKYYGAVVGLENLSLEVAQGEVFGFLGANGAGKTTTIRMLLDLVRPTRGTASILYSHGMKRKLGLIQALMTEAPVLVLDEPTSGLDPLMIEAFSQTVDELARGGRTTVFLSSHILSEVDRICQRIGLVRGGQLVAVRTLKELRAAAPRRMTVSFGAGQRRHAEPGRRDARRPRAGALGARCRGPARRHHSAARQSACRRRAAGSVHTGRSDPAVDGFSAVQSGVEGRRGRPEMTALVVRSLGRVRILSTSLALVLIGLQLAIIAAAASFADGGNFERLAQIVPAFVMQTMGPALTSFSGMVLFAYFDPLIVMLLVQFAIYLATEPAGEVESNLVDLILARPLPRHWMVTRSFLVMAIGTVVTSGAMVASTWAGLWWMAPLNTQWPAPRTVISMSAHMTLIAWCFGCAALAASGWARRRGAVVGAVGVVAIAAYLVELLESIWAPARELAPFSPFHYYSEAGIIAGTGGEARDFAVLGSIVLAAMAVAYWRYQRRDL
jgi:ABC-type transporter Mla maintaining outer membrane lipid asymmetry ATPase subunit MlaF